MNIYQPFVKLDLPTGKLIGFTSNYFDHTIVWNAMPVGVRFNSLRPKPGVEDEAIKQLLVRINKLGLKANFLCPHPHLVKYLIDFRYSGYYDPAGSPMWANLSAKGFAAVIERGGYKPIQIDQELIDFCNAASPQDYFSPSYRIAQHYQPASAR